MFLEEYKAGLHKQIDSCEDENRLKAVRAILAADSTFFDALSIEVQTDVLQSMKEAKDGKGISWEEYKAERVERRRNA